MRAIDLFGLLRVARSDRRAAAAVLAVAAVLAASVFALRLVVTDPNAAVLVLLSVPVALVAIVLGRWGGLAAAGGALVLVAVYHVAGHPLDWVGYVARGSAFVLLGFGMGAFSDYAVAAQRRLSTLLDGTLDAVTVGTPVRDATGNVVDGRVAYANGAAVSFFGRSPGEILGRRWSELWPGSFTPDLFAALVAVIQTGEPVELTDFEIPLDHPSGTLPVTLDLRATAFDDGLMVAWREVSARLRDARAVAAASARFAAAFDHAPVGMLLVDPDRVIVQANAAFGAISGRPTEELVGMPLDALIDPRDLPDSRVDFARLMTGETSVYHRERRLVTADGEARWVAVRVSRITGEDDGAYAVQHVEDIHERKSLEHRLQHLADHDALTGLFNRRRFYEEVSHQLALDERYGRSSIVALIDLDNFKYINDTLGHAAGDQLIQDIARTLRARLRASDVLGRLGGDEFGVLLPTRDKLDLAAAIGSLLAAVTACEVDWNGQRVRSTASIGVATLDGEAGGDPDTALANADLAMYAAKEAGRNTFIVYDPHGPHAERSRARFRWLDRIRNALDHDLFILVGQPILEIATGNITGCELLLRMREDDRLILPDRFLYIAERHGLATAIDRVVISNGIALAAASPRPAGFRWEINLSADALSDPGISDLIEAELARTGVPPGALVFEITETAAIANMSQAQVFATRITDIGCRFALDDFGAGYGSFYYLKHLPFAYLKIDGEFIRQLTSNHTDRVIVQAIVTAAHDLDKQTIAEYVGDADTLDLLRQLHVDHAQGHHIGPASDALAHAPIS